jgi:hypothetical protein
MRVTPGGDFLGPAGFDDEEVRRVVYFKPVSQQVHTWRTLDGEQRRSKNLHLESDPTPASLNPKGMRSSSASAARDANVVPPRQVDEDSEDEDQSRLNVVGQNTGLRVNRRERWYAPSTPMFRPCIFRVMVFLAAVWIAVPAQGGLISREPRESSLARENQALRDERLYEHLLAQRSLNPAAFDHHHPFYGQLLTDRPFFEYWFDRWQAHPARFEHWYPRFWHILDGEALCGGPRVFPSPFIPPAGQGPNSPPLPPSPPEGPLPPPSAVVPEPSSLFLFLAGLGILLLVENGRRLPRR